MPDLQIADPREAAMAYWDLYYGLVYEAIHHHPERIKLFAAEELGTTDGQHRILNCVGVPRQRHIVHAAGVWANTRNGSLA